MKSKSAYLLAPFLLSVFGCNQSGPTSPNADPSSSSIQTRPGSTSFADEIINLKSQHLKDENVRYAEIMAKYGMSTELPRVEAPATGFAPKPTRPVPLAKTADGFTEVWTEVFSTPAAPVQKVFYKKIQLTAGTKYVLTTTTTNSNIDPVMAVVQVDNANWSSTGDLPFGTVQSKVYMISFNDDNTGLMPRCAFTAPTTGWYGVLVFAYSQNNQGNVNLVHGVACATQPTTGYCISGTTNSEVVNVRGQLLNYNNYYSGDFSGGKLTSSDGGDPMLWMFDRHDGETYSLWRGMENDDDVRGGTVNSYLARPAFGYDPISASDYRFAILSGYRDGGTAVFHGGTIELSGCQGMGCR